MEEVGNLGYVTRNFIIYTGYLALLGQSNQGDYDRLHM